MVVLQLSLLLLLLQTFSAWRGYTKPGRKARGCAAASFLLFASRLVAICNFALPWVCSRTTILQVNSQVASDCQRFYTYFQLSAIMAEAESFNAGMASQQDFFETLWDDLAQNTRTKQQGVYHNQLSRLMVPGMAMILLQ